MASRLLKKKARELLAIALVVLAAGCASAPTPKPLTREEQIKHDSSVGMQIAPELESQFKIKSDPEISGFLKHVANALADHSEELHGIPNKIILIEDVEGKWSSYSVPGNRLYVSVGMLRGLQFENEDAAIIAFQLAFIAQRHLLNHYEWQKQARPMDDPRLFGENGLFSASSDELKDAVGKTVDILYRAGYDPRGLVAIFARYRQNPEQSPYTEELLADLIHQSRQSIALYAPLRNPVVRSKAFIRIQKRMRSL